MQDFEAATVPLTPGVTLIEASAGTGKTFAITRLVLRLLLRPEPIALREIAVVTFTEKGSNELVTRIRKTLRRARELSRSDGTPQLPAHERDLAAILSAHRDIATARLDAACSELDQLSVSTIHAFCLRILAEEALEAGVHFDAGFLENDTEVFIRAAHDWARRTLVRDAEAAQAVVAQDGDPTAWVGSLVRPLTKHPRFEIAGGSSALLKGYVTSVLDGAAKERQRRHLLTFDDTLSRLHQRLQREGPHGQLATRIRQRYRAALIDEFQDTDAFQFPIFRTAFEGLPLFLIGDPKQSIYAFRGADVRAYLLATATAAHRFTLRMNHRSTPAMVNAVNALFGNQPTPFGEHLGIPFTPAESADRATIPAALASEDEATALQWLLLDAKQKALSKADALTGAIGATVTEVHALLVRGLPAQDIAILVQTNDEARDMKAGLDAAGIAAVVTSNRDVLESDEGEEIIRIALAIAEPGNEQLIRGAIATRCWGATAADIARLLHTDGSRDWGEVVLQFREAHDRWVRTGLAAALTCLLSARETAPRLGALPNGERRLTNLRHLLDLLREEGTGGRFPPTAFRAWLAREQGLSTVPERREQRLESDAAAVQILTIHKAKGLQWPVVFCPTLWSYTEHGSSVMGIPTAIATIPRTEGSPETVRRLDIGSPSVGDLKETVVQDARDEQMRLTYVALTRAESRCYVIWGAINQSEDSALAQLIGDAGSVQTLRGLIAAQPPEVMRVAPAEDETRSGILTASGRLAGAASVRREARRFVAPADRFATWETSSYSRLIDGQKSSHPSARDVADDALPLRMAGPAEPATGIFAVPKGAQTGNVLHDLLEHLDFTTAASETAFAGALPLERVERALTRQGVTCAPDARWSAQDLQRVIFDTCRAPIPATSFRFADVPMARSLREWKFTIPVGTCDVRAIADALAAHGSTHGRAYATRLRDMDVERFRGYLDGVIDLAFEHEGRWWIVDWKSNHLGDRAADYHTEAVDQAMQLSSYTLQYHLYLVALHRHLRARMPGYDPATHWGGIAYVFLRGVTPDGTTGWFRDTPSPALIAALDDALHPAIQRNVPGVPR